jgi:hypothetical protein
MLLYWDAYYSEQAIAYETGCTQDGRTARTETPIAMGWVTAALGGYFALAVGVASLINWLS